MCYFFKMILLIVVSLLSYSLCEESPAKYPENTADISSINNLAYKPSIALDPKIRKALLNVLNRLEQQETAEPAGIKSSPENYEQQQVSDDVKWEYKTNDTFKEYNYYEIVQDKPSPTSPTSASERTQDKESNTDEPGALFFQVPENQHADPGQDKHESLNLQETKIALTPEQIFSNLENEIRNEQKNTKLSNGTASSNSENNEDDVEVFQAPLLTAFTLEQDERGLPRRIIPLDTAELSSILDNKINLDPTQETRKAREQQIARTSDTSQIRNIDATQPPRNLDQASPTQNEQNKRYQLNFESQLLELQEQKRQFDLEKQRFLIEQEKQQFLIEQENARRLKLALEFRERENFLRSIKQNEIPRQEVALQKSIPLEVYNTHSPVIQRLPFIQYQPQFEFPDTVDRQLQNLFQRSGINQGKHEDLNIVSKVLALNYNDQDKPRVSTERASTVPANFRNKRRSKDNLLWN